MIGALLLLAAIAALAPLIAGRKQRRIGKTLQALLEERYALQARLAEVQSELDQGEDEFRRYSFAHVDRPEAQQYLAEMRAALQTEATRLSKRLTKKGPDPDKEQELIGLTSLILEVGKALGK